MKLHSVEKMIIIVLVVCGVISMIGYSFAYFVSGVKLTGDGANTTGTTADMIKVSYDAGDSALSFVNAYPGKSASKNFSITVTPTSDMNSAKYAIKLNIDTNTFVVCSDANYNASTNACVKNAEELIYTLKDGNGTTLATGDITTKTGEVVVYTDTKTTNVETVYNYTLEITFKNTNSDQNHNTNKSLTGSLKVEFAE